MMRSLWSAASGMIAQQTNLDTIANNLSNVNTAGYKKDTAEFKSLLYQTLQSPSTNNVGENKPVPAQVGLGTRTAAITKVFTQGNLQDVDNTTYLALDGKGFFKVRNKDGEVCYTRDGSFDISPTPNGNMLCTSQGAPVLDQNNNTIIIPPGYKVDSISISDDGKILVEGADGKQVPLTKTINGTTYEQSIGVVQFNNPAGLNSLGGNLYQASVASGDAIEESTNPNLKRSKIYQGYLEMSNVQVADEMVNMIVAQRAYEMNSKAIQASDEMLGQANNLRR
ncbi:MAG: flagellar basal-body rod protein FlgG [Eubacteriales bacterium]|nr:flagellar basal-body rod protein FlgG [Eubacteriales bacterium]